MHITEIVEQFAKPDDAGVIKIKSVSDSQAKEWQNVSLWQHRSKNGITPVLFSDSTWYPEKPGLPSITFNVSAQ
jgi:hypothetical protein